MGIKNIEEKIKNFWKKSWWTKVIGIILIFFLWPFVVGWLLTRLVFNKVSNKKLRLALSTVILLPTLLFGTAWIAASPFFTPTPDEPVVALNDFETDKTVTASEFVISGKVEPPGSTIKVNGRDADVNEDGTFSYTVSLEEGENEIKVVANNSGLTSEFIRKVTRELTEEEKATIAAEDARKAEEARLAAEEEARRQAEEAKKAAETATKPKTMLDKLWKALDAGIKTRTGYDISYDKSIKDAILTYYKDTFWDENSVVRDSYTALVKFGREAFKIDGVATVTIVFKTDFTDSYGNKSQDEAVIITMKKGDFNKFNWDNLDMQLVSRQIEAASEVYYIHPAVRKNLNEDKLWLSL